MEINKKCVWEWKVFLVRPRIAAYLRLPRIDYLLPEAIEILIEIISVA